MSYVTANGFGVSEARLVFPLTGAWHTDLLVTDANAITGAVAVDLGGDLTLQGTVLVGGVYTQAAYIRVLAGKGGWQAQCTPKYYQGVTLGMILAELLAQGGDVLSSKIDATARNTLITTLGTSSATVGVNVRNLLAYAPAGTSYRFLPDGTFWIGPETWGAFTKDYQVTSEEPIEQRLELGSQSPTLIAGQSVVAESGTVHVNRVETAISTSGFRSQVWWQS